jgi:hypothetical protein
MIFVVSVLYLIEVNEPRGHHVVAWKSINYNVERQFPKVG